MQATVEQVAVNIAETELFLQGRDFAELYLGDEESDDSEEPVDLGEPVDLEEPEDSP